MHGHKECIMKRRIETQIWNYERKGQCMRKGRCMRKGLGLDCLMTPGLSKEIWCHVI